MKKIFTKEQIEKLIDSNILETLLTNTISSKSYISSYDEIENKLSKVVRKK